MLIQKGTLRCDVCNAEVEVEVRNSTPVLPWPWKTLRWRPGVVTPPDEPVKSGIAHTCSPECREKKMTEKDPKPPKPAPDPNRCPFHSRAQGFRCEKEKGHEGMCSNAGDGFAGGHIPSGLLDE